LSESFADAESSYNEARFVYYGYPFDGTACFRKGTSEAPDAIRKNSYNFETYLLELGIDLSDVSANDWGNLKTTDNQDKNEKLLEDLVSKIVNEGKFPIGLGGEHSLTPAAVKAAHAKYPNLAVVILDAHLDFRKEYEGNSKSHATVTRRVSEIVGIDNVRSIGIRSVSQSELTEARSVGLKFVESGWTELREYLADVIEDLEGPVYLSLDMDVIDPAFAPGVGTPEPFGMTPYEIMQTINFFADRIVGFDCVEVCPPYDNGNTSALAARLTRHLVGAVWQSQERFK
jgi:agmatinase|tara:strand:+ start:1034 stop:1894 length:861 start_codon:yes stop_codon:yes gene_type:complete